jgi:branched-chain amino acid transport system substrate-binding protein
MKKMGIILLTVILSVIFAMVPPVPAATPEIRIGSNQTMSGPGAQFGISAVRAEEAVIERINKEGGLAVGSQRYIIKMFKYDNKRDPTTAVENTKMLINTDKVNFMFVMSATNVVPALPIMTASKIISMDMSASSKTLQGAYNFNFLAAGPYQSDASFKAWVSKFGIKKIAEINPDDEAGQAGKAENKVAAKDNGVEILSSLFYTPGTTDFYPVLTKSLATKPDMLVIGMGLPGVVPLIVKQARELGWTGLLAQAQGNAPVPQTFVQIAGKAAEGYLWSNVYSFDPNFWTKEERDWANYWKDHWTEPFMSDSFGGYRHITLLTQAVQKAGTLDPDQIVKVLETSDFAVMGWKVRFGTTADCYQGRPRSLRAPLYLMTIKDGNAMVTDVLLPKGVEKIQ